MEQGIKCPNCGGDKFKFLAQNTFKCAYCGHTFTHEMPAHSTNTNTTYTPPQQPIIMVEKKEKMVAVVLAFLLGGIGAHKFYLRQVGLGIVYLLFCLTYIPSIIAFIEGIILLTMSKEEFDHKYNQY
jgi:TM2 domain-containing membrane protein YozV/rubredoxin